MVLITIISLCCLFLMLSAARHLSRMSDKELVQYFRRQTDAQAIAILLSRHNGLIFGMAMKRLKDEAATEDFVGDIFLKVYDKLQKSEVSNFRSWLGSMVNNQLHDMGRKQKVRAMYEQGPKDESSDPEKHWQWAMDETALSDAIAELKDNEKIVIRGVYFEEKSYHEIGEEQGWSFNQIRGARERAIRKLRDKLGLDFENYFKD